MTLYTTDDWNEIYESLDDCEEELISDLQIYCSSKGIGTIDSDDDELIRLLIEKFEKYILFCHDSSTTEKLISGAETLDSLYIQWLKSENKIKE
jgi:hypothetical protein